MVVRQRYRSDGRYDHRAWSALRLLWSWLRLLMALQMLSLRYLMMTCTKHACFVLHFSQVSPASTVSCMLATTRSTYTHHQAACCRCYQPGCHLCMPNTCHHDAAQHMHPHSRCCSLSHTILPLHHPPGCTTCDSGRRAAGRRRQARCWCCGCPARAPHKHAQGLGPVSQRARPTVPRRLP